MNETSINETRPCADANLPFLDLFLVVFLVVPLLVVFVRPAVAAPLDTSAYSEVSEELRRAGLSADYAEPFRIDPEMEAWTAEKVSGSLSPTAALRSLLEALRNAEPPFRYESGFTGTAVETFHSREYNCLSFSILFYSLARSRSLPAYFLDVDRQEEYSRAGDLVVLTRHVTAGYGVQPNRKVLEFDVGPQVNYDLAAPIGPLEALALYYSNRGTEEMRAGELRRAVELLELAVRLAPENPQSWVNLGVARRQVDELDAAEAAYLHAIELEERYTSAYYNLLVLRRAQGDPKAMDEVFELLQQRDLSNAFAYLTIADMLHEAGRLSEAGDYYRKAHKLRRDDPEIQAALGLWYLRMGKTSRAESLLRRSAEEAPAHPRVQALEAAIHRGDETDFYPEDRNLGPLG